MAGLWRVRFQSIDLWTIVSRFPVPVFCAAALTGLMWRFDGAVRNKAEPWGHLLGVAIAYLVPFLIAAFLYSFAIQLYREAADKRARSLIALVLGLAVLAWIFEPHIGLEFLFWPSNTDVIEAAAHSSTRANPWLGNGAAWASVLAAVAFFPFGAPYLRGGTGPGAFWQFAHKLTVSVIAAGVGSGLAYGGIAAVLLTAKLLFGFEAQAEYFTKSAVLAFCFGAPLIVMALTPSSFDELPRTGSDKEFTSRAVSLMVRFILIPLATVLSLMLGAYVVLVLWRQGFTEAKLGRGSLIYGIGIVATALLALPDAAESRIARTFMRLWPWFLIPPTILLFPSIFIRISDYGWTPLRYFVFLGGIWMALVMAVGLIRRHELRTVPVLATVLFALAAYGPLSVTEVTGRSQARQIEALLTAKGALAGGKWQEKQHLTWAHDEQQKLITALDALELTSQLGRLKPWFEDTANSPFAGTGWRASLNARLNVGTYAEAQPQTILSFKTSQPRAVKVPSESILFGPINIYYYSNASWSGSSPIGPLTAKPNGKVIEVSQAGGKTVKFDLNALLVNEKNGGPPLTTLKSPETPIIEMPILEGEGDLRVKAAIAEAEVNVTQNKTRAEFYLIFPVSP